MPSASNCSPCDWSRANDLRERGLCPGDQRRVHGTERVVIRGGSETVISVSVRSARVPPRCGLAPGTHLVAVRRPCAHCVLPTRNSQTVIPSYQCNSDKGRLVPSCGAPQALGTRRVIVVITRSVMFPVPHVVQAGPSASAPAASAATRGIPCRVTVRMTVGLPISLLNTLPQPVIAAQTTGRNRTGYPCNAAPATRPTTGQRLHHALRRDLGRPPWRSRCPRR